MSQGIEEELFVVATKRKDGSIPLTAKILGGEWYGQCAASFYSTQEEAEEIALYMNRRFGLFYKAYRAVVRLEECSEGG